MPEEGEAESQQLDSPDTTARTTPRPREAEGSQSRGSGVTGAGAPVHAHLPVRLKSPAWLSILGGPESLGAGNQQGSSGGPSPEPLTQ